MPDNTSEVDEITRETSRLGIQITRLIGAWRTMNPTATRVPRSVRREINQAIKVDAQEQQFAHAQERARMQRAVTEYRWKLLQDRTIRSWDTQSTWFERQRDLAVAHDRLHSSIYNTAYLTATERGQVSQAINRIHRNPYAPAIPMFGKTSGLAALRTKLADGITRLRAGLADPAEQRRLQQWNDLHAERATHAEQRRQRPDWLFTPDPNQPIPFVPTDYPGLHRDPASGVPRPVTVRDLTKRISRYSELRFGPDDDKTTPEDLAAYDRRASEYRDVLIADAHLLGAEQAELVATALNNIDLAHGIRREGQALRDLRPERGVDPDSGIDPAATSVDPQRAQRVGDLDREQLAGNGNQVSATVPPREHPGPAATGATAPPKITTIEEAVEGLSELIKRNPHAAAHVMRQVPELAGMVANRLNTPQRPGDQNSTTLEDRHIEVDGPAGAPAEQTGTEHNPGYEVVVGTTEFVTKRPDMVDRGIVSTLSDGYGWALNQLGNDKQGWPAEAELAVRIYRPGSELPVFSTVGPRGMVTDEVTQARTEHNRTPLAEVEHLRAELHAAHTENNQLRTENTDLVRKFAEHDLNPDRSAPTPTMPQGPKLARPIFDGPVLIRPAMNGVDR